LGFGKGQVFQVLVDFFALGQVFVDGFGLVVGELLDDLGGRLVGRAKAIPAEPAQQPVAMTIKYRAGR
jgi:hypothetical protein